MFQKGWDNIFLMSGGLEEFVILYPEYLYGPGSAALINAKNQAELLKKDGNNNELLINSSFENHK